MLLPNASWLNFTLLLLAAGRILLDLFSFDLNKLPLTKHLGPRGKLIHRWGLIFSWGYFILFVPAFLWGTNSLGPQ